MGLMRNIAMLATCLYLASGCGKQPEHRKDLDKLDNTVKIASFNIENYSTGKAEKRQVLNTLASILTNFDVTAVQEIRDQTDDSISKLVGKMNSIGNQDEYAYLISPQVGTDSRKERYAFIYRKSKVRHAGNDYLYEDKGDVFAREPYIAGFRAGNFDFTLVNIHVDPDEAWIEILYLERVARVVDKATKEDNDVVVIGDLNADGSYFSERHKRGFRGKEFLWCIPDDFDTSLGKESKTLDRIVAFQSSTAEDFTGKAGVFRFDEMYKMSIKEAESISDHYPVWALFYTDRDTD